MTEEEFKKFCEDFRRAEEEASRKRDAYRKEIVPGILKMPIEGFVSEEDKITLSDDLEIERVNEDVRDQFFQRAASLELRDYRSENNKFFLTYKFDDERWKLGGIETGNRILLVAIYFAICCGKRVRINKSQGFVPIQGEFQSIGIHRIPYAPWSYDPSVYFESEVIDDLRRLWPLFRDSYTNQSHFTLISRRYYFSLIRDQWEDQLIDLIISLEALLIPESDEVNKSGKISKRLSRMVSKQFQRGEVSKVALECYNLRNTIVHGKHTLLDDDHIDYILGSLKSYVNAALKLYLIEYKDLTPNELVDKLENMNGDQI